MTPICNRYSDREEKGLFYTSLIFRILRWSFECYDMSFYIMVKEAKNIDFYTTGRQPSDLDFERISEWIRKKKNLTKAKRKSIRRKQLA